jgi:hypothetical protein
MPSILYTTSSNSIPQPLEGNFNTVKDVRQHLIQKLGITNIVLTLGERFRTPLDDSELLIKYCNKPVKIPTIFHAELI